MSNKFTVGEKVFISRLTEKGRPMYGEIKKINGNECHVLLDDFVCVIDQKKLRKTRLVTVIEKVTKLYVIDANEKFEDDFELFQSLTDIAYDSQLLNEESEVLEIQE